MGEKRINLQWDRTGNMRLSEAFQGQERRKVWKLQGESVLRMSVRSKEGVENNYEKVMVGISERSKFISSRLIWVKMKLRNENWIFVTTYAFVNDKVEEKDWFGKNWMNVWIFLIGMIECAC